VQKAFYSAALVQYNVGHGGDSIGSLAALQLLNLTATFSGQGNVGTQLLRQAIAMGKRMNLLSNGVALTEKAPLDGIDMRVASQASWGLFCYAT
jgi:hypothetical protein